MKLLAALASAAVLTGCQTITVQGVEISKETQAATAVLLIAGGIAIAHFADGGAGDAAKPACKTFTSPPDAKGGEPVCAVPLD